MINNGRLGKGNRRTKVQRSYQACDADDCKVAENVGTVLSVVVQIGTEKYKTDRCEEHLKQLRDVVATFPPPKRRYRTTERVMVDSVADVPRLATRRKR